MFLFFALLFVHFLAMGCGGSKKSSVQVPRIILPVSESLQQAPKCHPQEEGGKLPQLVIEGMSKILKMPLTMKRAIRPKPQQGINPFVGIIEDSIVPVQGEGLAAGRGEETLIKAVIENPFPVPTQDDVQKNLREEIEGEEAEPHSQLTSYDTSKSEAKEKGDKAHPAIPISTDAWVGASTLPVALDPLPSDCLGAEERVQSRAAAPAMQRPATSQALAAERLAKVYNQARGLSPEPPMEQSDEEEEYDAAEDEARRARRLTLEQANREEAMRRSAERRTEEERLLAIQTALLGAKSSAAANILSKYL
jgi:hypothetical protein